MNVIIIKEIRKTLSININLDLTITVKAPLNCNDTYIYDFIEKNKEKLLKKLEKTKIYNAEIEKFKKDGVFLLFSEKSNIPLKDKSKFNKISKEYLTERLNYLANIYNFKINNIIIKNFKSRWGSCDRFKNISLNYKLIMLDKELIDYVLIHELCHIKHLNHGKNFHNLLKSYLPNVKSLRKRLNSKFYLAKI